jgi:hypothetical protein
LQDHQRQRPGVVETLHDILKGCPRHLPTLERCKATLKNSQSRKSGRMALARKGSFGELCPAFLPVTPKGLCGFLLALMLTQIRRFSL